MGTRGRRRKGRRRVEYQDVVPSTDLPPLVEGELRCFLFVTIGELIWGSTTSAKIPPAAPVYIRLRWWGEASNGTNFRPQSQKDNLQLKTRAQFGIRSGPKQIAAYFNDMGSATFDVLTSPTSLPIGRIQVPGMSALSSSNPVKGFYPIISASSRKLGELKIAMSFKPLRAAYDDSTDGSFSSRSRATSAGGSRRNSQSRASSIGSAKSRSSSRGSQKEVRIRSRSNSSNTSSSRRSSSRKHATKQRSRSRSNDSKASQTSKTDVATPRGIDALLERNGLDLYGMTEDNARRKRVQIKTTVSSAAPSENSHVDAIGELLKRGKQLREEISQSAGHRLPPQNLPKPQSPKCPIEHCPAQQEQLSQVPKATAYSYIPSAAPPVSIGKPPSLPQVKSPTLKRQKSNTEMRIVDMVLRAKGMKEEDLSPPDVSGVSSPLYSMVSDVDDPLHDESILEHLFYNGTKLQSGKASEPIQSTHEGHVTEQRPSEVGRNLVTKINPEHPSKDAFTSVLGKSEEKVSKLGHVTIARVHIHSLQLASSMFSEDLTSSKRETSRIIEREPNKSKPPMTASPSTKATVGTTFFVEYKFPRTTPQQRSIAATSSTHEITRIASRKMTQGGLVKFDQHSSFNIRFNAATITKWCSDDMEFVVYQKKPKDKKPSIIGTANLPLRCIIENEDLSFSDLLNVISKNADRTYSRKIHGAMKISVNLASDSKDLSTRMSPVKKPAPVQYHNTYSVTKLVKPSEREENTPSEVVPSESKTSRDEVLRDGIDEQTKVCIAADPTTFASCQNEVCPRTVSTVLYLYVFLERARDIPATRLQSGANSGKSCQPNVYLVCRTFATDESSSTSVVWNTPNPKFGFPQVIPVTISNHLFTRIKDSYVVVEVWTKVPSGSKFSDKLMGLVKLPLQLFYQSLKDPEVARAVLKADYPLVSVDGYQPIIDVFSGHERGQLKLLLALGTQTQINTLRKSKDFDEGRIEFDKHHLDDTNPDENDERDDKIPLQHNFQLTVQGLHGFKPQNTQVWGETDCFIQYSFPTQLMLKDDVTHDESTSDEDTPNVTALRSYRTDTTLCVPNPQFKFTKTHKFQPPPAIPVQRLLLSACSKVGKYPGGGIPFELWSRFYYPNVRDQLLAKGFLPAAKLCSVVSMKKQKSSEKSFQVPLEFVDAESETSSAGDLNVTVKYKTIGLSKESIHPAQQFCKNVKLQIAVLRACGLKSAAKLASTLHGDSDLDYCCEVGVNSYAIIKPSFLPAEKRRQTRCVARSFSPDYNHHFEVDCPVVFYQEHEVAPSSLAQLLASGEIQLEIWHRPVTSDNVGSIPAAKDVLLGRVNIPTSSLLYKTTGCNGWCAITSLESLQHKSSTTIGAVEISVSLARRSDLDLVLRAARAAGWTPSIQSDLCRLLVPDSNGVLKPKDEAAVPDEFLTACVTVTNAWLPKKIVALPGSEEINKHAHVYLRYKFYDKDTVISSICPVNGSGIKKTFKQHCMLPVKLAHRKSFLCKPTQPLVWYFREEMLEIQLWFSYSRSSRTRRRPFDTDKLLGSSLIDMSGILTGELHKQQHISGLYPLFKASVDDLADASIRVYFSVNPGDHTKPFDMEDLDETSNNLSSSSDNVLTMSSDMPEVPEEVPKVLPQPDNSNAFPATVSVEKAMHLTPMPPVASFTPDGDNARSSCYVTFTVADSDNQSVESTRAVLWSSCPVWNDAREVMIDKKFLNKDNGSLVFKVWQRAELEESSSSDDSASVVPDQMIGFASVDVSVISAGFNSVNGWYNILDIHGSCQGQIKVAVTPTAPTNFSNDITQEKAAEVNIPNAPGSPSKGILHSVPLLGPVQTPSGSMYYPGVLSSAKTVCTSCPQSQTSPSVNFTTSSSRRLFKDGAVKTSLVNVQPVPSIPSRTLFKYDKKTCLHDALQRQIKELDKIKETFQQKEFTLKYNAALPNQESSIFNLFATSSHAVLPAVAVTSTLSPTSLAQADATTAAEPAVTTTSRTLTSTTFFVTPPSTQTLTTFAPPSDLFIPANAPFASNGVDKNGILPSQNDLLLNRVNESTPQSVARTSTVHMSLFKPGTNDVDYDGVVLSDNELSDVEFVRPKNLNDQSALFSDSPEEPHNVVTEAPEHQEDTAQQNTDVSELNNTSLWLSGSTSLVEENGVETYHRNVSQPHSDDAETSAKKQDDGSKVTFLVPSGFDEEVMSEVETLPEKELTRSDKSDGTSGLSTSEGFDSAEPEEPADIASEMEQVHESRSEQEETTVSSITLPLDDMEKTDTNDTDHTDADDEVEERSHPAPVPSSGVDHVPLPSSGLDQQHLLNGSRQDEVEQEETTEDEDFNEDDDVTLPKSTFSNGDIPSSETPPSSSAPHPSSGLRQVPSFFPPHQDLLASMRALQAITAEQKRKLLSKEPSEEKEVACSSNESTPSQQSRRKLVKPSTVSAEQTKRLARIFKTKYTSN